jgi:hypothetical protein
MSKARDLADLLTDGKVEADDLDVGQLGGRRNLIINGGFDVWQRGTSFTNTSQYTADRWFFGNPGTSSVTQVTTPYGYGVSYTRTGGNWGTFTRLEWKDLSFLKVGDKLTLQYVSNRNTPNAHSLHDAANNGTIKFPSNAMVSEGNGYYKYTGTLEVTQQLIDACAAVDMMQLGIEPYSSEGEFTITDVQLELGSVATPFEQRPYGLELSLCQRYYETGTFGRHTGVTYTANGDTRSPGIRFAVQKRIPPSIPLTNVNVIGTGDVGVVVNIVFPVSYYSITNEMFHIARINNTSDYQSLGSVMAWGDNTTAGNWTADAEL